MANCRARAYGFNSTGSTSEASRLGSQGAMAHADTWQTFTTVFVARDGSGYVKVERPKGTIIHAYDFEAES